MNRLLQNDISNLAKLDICLIVLKNIYFTDQEIEEKIHDILYDLVRVQNKLVTKVDNEVNK